MFFCGYYISKKSLSEEDIDYSKYLGPNWKENKFEGKRVPSLVSNHMGFLEITGLISIMTPPSFTPMAGIKKMPIGDHFVSALQSLYVDKAMNKAGKDGLVEEIIARQKTI